MHTESFVVAADGTRIAYRANGNGPTLVLANGWTTTVGTWRYLIPRWTEHYRVITWDYKGHGRSEPAHSLDGVTIPALVDDMRRILDACEVTRAAFIGYSMGCQVVLEAFRQIPDRIRGLVSILGFHEHMLSGVLTPLIGPAAARILRLIPKQVIHASMRQAHRLMQIPVAHTVAKASRLAGPNMPWVDLERYIDHFGKMDPYTVLMMAAAAEDHSTAELLPRLTVPVLIIGGQRDLYAPTPLVAKALQSKIPNSELVDIPLGTHTSIFEHPLDISNAVERFVASLPD